eukprot:TRINITY_DN79760_c0_g1_i1.p1 TRINITY_DN79760_c0_g1~~TRINITY_DN79760_c0_g1_i1.p1  ORF type:complete len:348 (-),score=92.89 TRINITY_DN79760_c0_g1_i1:32-1075(-)
MAEVAARVLAAAAEEEIKYASIQVEKPIDLELDLGNMLALDNNQIDNTKLQNSEEREEYLAELARDNTQILINAIWGLPTEKVDEVIVAKFPPPSFRLPREKPAPKPKLPTKWEQYAKEKGIVKKKKKDPLVWDDIVQKWVPQFGYKKKLAEKEKNWCIPIKETADPVLNPHEKMVEDKKERVAKNELQRLRNLARTKKVKVPTVGVITPSAKGASSGFSDDLKEAADFVKSSTASLGKFQPNLSKSLEQKAKLKGKKRKFESNTGDMSQEKERNLGILESMTNKQAKLDINSAVGKQIHHEDSERSEERRKGKGRGGKAKGKSKGRKTFTQSKKQKKAAARVKGKK